MNENADDFLRDLDTEHEESVAERKGRHYVEGEARFATVAALTELTRTVTQLTRAQAVSAREMGTLSRELKSATGDIAKVKRWMEGSVDNSGTRTPGFLDHVATFVRWKNWVLGLLAAIFTAEAVDATLRALDHANTIHAITKGTGQ